MVLAAPDRGEITTALIAMLAADTGELIGDGEAPGDENTPPTLPFAIVYAVVGGPTAGAINAVTMPDRSQLMSWQVTSVGEEREQADWMAHKCRRAITDVLFDPHDWRLAIGSTNALVIDRTHNLSSGTNKEGTWWNSIDRYQLLVVVRGPDAVM